MPSSPGDSLPSRSLGGDYADLFEYRAAGGLTLDEGILKSASRGVSLGLGVRVQKGDATGYAYVEQFDWDAMKRAAETASQIASGGGAPAPLPCSRLYCRSATSLRRSRSMYRGWKNDGFYRAAAAAHAVSPHIVKVQASLAEEIRESRSLPVTARWRATFNRCSVSVCT